MKRLAIAAVCVLTLAACNAGPRASSADIPSGEVTADGTVFEPVQAGLWDLDITQMPDGPGGLVPAGGNVRACSDGVTPLQMGIVALPGSECPTSSARGPHSGIIFSSHCSINGVQVFARGVFAGDFQEAYSTIVESDVQDGVTPNGDNRRVTTVRARHAGDCPDGMQPGTVRIMGG